MLLRYQATQLHQGKQQKDQALSPAKISDDSWTMDGFVSVTTAAWGDNTILSKPPECNCLKSRLGQLVDI